MTLTEIRALPQELVEAFEEWWRATNEDRFDFTNANHTAQALWWIWGATMEDGPEERQGTAWLAWSAGYAYWLGKRGGK